MSVELYRWDDTGAPVLNGVQGAMVDVLRACLVDGYGALAGAGWTMPYINAEGTRASFRNDPLGTGFFLNVDQATTAANSVTFRPYEVMTSDVDGTFQFGGYTRDTAQTAGNVTPRPWVVVATGSWFYFLHAERETTGLQSPESIRTSSAYGITLFFGDIESVHNNDSYNCVIALSGTTTPGFGYQQAPNSGVSADYGVVARNVAGVAGNYPIKANAPPPSSSYGWGHSAAEYTGANALLTGRVMILDGTYTPRGFYPGLLVPLHGLQYGQLETVVIDLETYVALTWKSQSITTSTYYPVQALFGPLAV